MPDAINRSNSLPNRYYDSEQGMCVAEPDGESTQRIPEKAAPTAAAPAQRKCNSEAAQAGLVCARAVAGALELGPSVVGGLVAAFLGCAACGFALVEWSECKRGEGEGR